MKNPFKELRQRLGVTARDITLATGVDVHEIYTIELGYVAHPTKYAKALEALGVAKANELLADYDAWRKAQGVAKREELKKLAKGLV